MFSLVSIPQRENSNAIFASEKLENLDKLVDVVSNMAIKDVGYELNTETASDAKFEFASNSEKNYSHQQWNYSPKIV